MNELALFAGAGGGILGGHLLGWRTVCAVEYEPYAAAVLVQRQNDGILQPFPICDDVRTFDGKPWRGRVDVVSGGFPCQDISGAGNGAGITGERSGLWKEMARIICEVRPRYVFVENSPLLTSRGLDVVLGDLAAMGFNAEWGVLSAQGVGAPHIRERLWIVAHARGESLYCSVRPEVRTKLGRDEEKRCKNWELFAAASRIDERLDKWRQCMGEPALVRNDDGLAGILGRLKASGNGQVPAVAARAFTELAARLSPFAGEGDE